jgi:segregation and condensation protein A
MFSPRPATYSVELPAFSGPLDLLLHLIERNELDITAISLAAVTEQYLAAMELVREERLAQLMDFLVIAAKLLLIKSRALLPRPAALFPEDEALEDPAETLARQIRNYKRFKEVASWLGDRESQGVRTFLRVAPPPQIDGTLDLTGISIDTLSAALKAAIERSANVNGNLGSTVTQPKFTLEGQVAHLRSRLGTGRRVLFADLLSPAGTTWSELSVTLLAVLELMKREEISARQTVMFGPIELIALGPKAG